MNFVRFRHYDKISLPADIGGWGSDGVMDTTDLISVIDGEAFLLVYFPYRISTNYMSTPAIPDHASPGQMVKTHLFPGLKLT